MDDSGHFKFCFMVFGASIEGWKYCRLIFVDGTFLKCKFGGILLTALSQDGNNQIFPLSFAIVDSENDVSWTWFFEKI
uniref:MULE transposase domain-containing protein n=1 Tax=Cucumis melo TaxID=3656 RepID=A0A9I9EID0_CUCME